MSAQATLEQLRLAILAAAQESNLTLMNDLTVAYHKALGREAGERSAREDQSARVFAQLARVAGRKGGEGRWNRHRNCENACGND